MSKLELVRADFEGLTEVQQWMLAEIGQDIDGTMRLGRLTAQEAVEVLRRLVGKLEGCDGGL